MSSVLSPEANLKATLYTYHGFKQPIDLKVHQLEDGSLEIYFTKAVAIVNADYIVLKEQS